MANKERILTVDFAKGKQRQNGFFLRKQGVIYLPKNITANESLSIGEAESDMHALPDDAAREQAIQQNPTLDIQSGEFIIDRTVVPPILKFYDLTSNFYPEGRRFLMERTVAAAQNILGESVIVEMQ